MIFTLGSLLQSWDVFNWSPPKFKKSHFNCFKFKNKTDLTTQICGPYSLTGSIVRLALLPVSCGRFLLVVVEQTLDIGNILPVAVRQDDTVRRKEVGRGVTEDGADDGHPHQEEDRVGHYLKKPRRYHGECCA